MSRNSKDDEMTDFYKLLNSFLDEHEATTIETNDRKNSILSYVKSI